MARFVVPLWIGVVAVWLSIWFGTAGFDDPYITYRYALNLSRGDGFVYNHGEHVLSTTAPLYALLLVPFAWAGLPLPLVSNLIGCASLALGGWVLWCLGRTWQTPLAGSAGLLLYPTCPLLITTLGAETAFTLTLILGGVLAYAQRHYRSVALLLALATMVRADSVLVALILAGAFLLRQQHPIPWSAIALYSALLLVWFGMLWYWFGSPVPVTLGAKQRQGMVPGSQSFFSGLMTLWYWFLPFAPIMLASAFIGCAFIPTRGHAWLLMLAWNLLYLLSYTALGVTNYPWYYAPLMVGLLPMVGHGIAAFGWMARRTMRLSVRYIWISSMTLLMLLTLSHIAYLHMMRACPDSRLAIYQHVGEWLYTHTPTNATVGALEVGIIGYYAERPMIDFAGLIQPEIAQQLSETQGYMHTAQWAIEQFRPDYLVIPRGMLPGVEQHPATRATCHIETTFSDDRYPHLLDIYRCSW